MECFLQPYASSLSDVLIVDNHQARRSCGVFTSHSSAGASTGESENAVSHQQKWCSWDSYIRGIHKENATANPLLEWTTSSIMTATLPKTCQDVFEKCELHTSLPNTLCSDRWIVLAVTWYEGQRESKAHHSFFLHCSSQGFNLLITKKWLPMPYNTIPLPFRSPNLYSRCITSNYNSPWRHKIPSLRPFSTLFYRYLRQP